MLSIFGVISYKLLFSKTELVIEETSEGPYYLVYQPIEGSYKQVADTYAPILRIVEEKGVRPLNPYVIYYSNPDKVPEEKLKSEAGFVIALADFPKIEGHLSIFQSRFFSKSPALIVRLPVNGQVPAKLAAHVHSELGKYTKEKNLKTQGAIIRKFNLKDGWVYFIAPLKQE